MAKHKSTTVVVKAVQDFDYLTGGREYRMTTRDGSRFVDFRRNDDSGIGTYIPAWQVKHGFARGALAIVEA